MNICSRIALGLAVLTTSVSAETTVPISDYSVRITLSETAAAKLASSGEWLHVWAHYFGYPIKEEDGDESGEIPLGSEETDIATAGSVDLGKIDISAAELRKVKGGAPTLLINVYTSRKVFEDNLLHCGLFEDLVEVASRKPVEIHCKLIGE